MCTGITIEVQPPEHVPKDGDGPIIFARTLEFAMSVENATRSERRSGPSGPHRGGNRHVSQSVTEGVA
jgi:hypothetical protein